MIERLTAAQLLERIDLSDAWSVRIVLHSEMEFTIDNVIYYGPNPVDIGFDHYMHFLAKMGELTGFNYINPYI